MKKIEWLDNFAESFSTKMNKTASKKLQSIIVDKSIVKNASVGDMVNYNGKRYKVADLDYVDNKGEGAVLDEVGYGEGISEKDPMSISMGAPVMNFTEGMTPQEYSRTNPGDVYDIPVEENFEQAAQETANQIANENAIDRTTVDNHYTDTRTEAPVMDVPAETPVEDVMSPETENVPEETPTDLDSPEMQEEEEGENEIAEEAAEEEKNASMKDTDETEDSDEDTDEFGGQVVAKRYNRILRRIMSSK